MPAGPPPLEPRIRKLEDKKRVPIWVWLITSLSAAAVIFGSVFLYVVTRSGKTPIQAAGGEAAAGEASKRPGPQPGKVGADDKKMTAVAGKDDRTPTSATAPAKTDVAKTQDGKSKTLAAPANSAASKGDSKSVATNQVYATPPNGKAGPPPTSNPSGHVRSERTGETKKQPPATVINGGDDPKKSPSDVRPKPTAKQLENEHGSKTAATAVKKQSETNTAVKVDHRGPSVNWPAFLAIDDVGLRNAGPIDVGKVVAGKRYLLAPSGPSFKDD